MTNFMRMLGTTPLRSPDDPAAAPGADPAADPPAASVPSSEPADPGAAADPAPKAPASPPTSALNPKPEEPAPSAQPSWPENWRDLMANGDDKVRKRMDRFASPDNVLKALTGAEEQLRSGSHKPAALPADATDKQVSDFRKAWGIPDEPGGYDTDLGDGRTFGEEDQPAIDGFLEAAHASNMPPEQVKGALSWYHDFQEQQIAAQAEADANQHTVCENTLAEDWGGERKLNLSLVDGLLTEAGADLKENLLGARMADGTLFGDNVEALKFLADAARKIRPLASLVDATGGDAAKSAQDELDALKGEMNAKRDPDGKNAYWRSEAKQKRYRDLLDGLNQAGVQGR